MIGAIILAAGESRRMGSQKLLLPYGGSTVIEHIIDEVLKSKIEQTIVVGGHCAAELRALVQNRPVTFVENSAYKAGMLTSVRAGLRALPDSIDAFMVVLGDQPSIRAEIIDFLLDAYPMCGRGILVPAHSDDTGHPIIISAAYRAEVLTKFDDTGLRGLIYGRPDEVCKLPVPFESILRDMDTPADYERELELHTMIAPKQQARRIMDDIGAVLREHWDPIGLDGVPADEYDSYIGPVYRLLTGKPSEMEVADLLTLLERNRMGLAQRPREDLIPVARQLLNLNVTLGPAN